MSDKLERIANEKLDQVSRVIAEVIDHTGQSPPGNSPPLIQVNNITVNVTTTEVKGSFVKDARFGATGNEGGQSAGADQLPTKPPENEPGKKSEALFIWTHRVIFGLGLLIYSGYHTSDMIRTTVNGTAGHGNQATIATVVPQVTPVPPPSVLVTQPEAPVVGSYVDVNGQAAQVPNPKKKGKKGAKKQSRRKQTSVLGLNCDLVIAV